jgi:hypothetical protein
MRFSIDSQSCDSLRLYDTSPDGGRHALKAAYAVACASARPELCTPGLYPS